MNDFSDFDEPYEDIDAEADDFGDNIEPLDVDAMSELGENNPLVVSALRSSEISRLPPPCEVVDMPGLNNSMMNHRRTMDFGDDVRIGDSSRVQEQETQYGEGGSLPESLHEDAHRLPRIRELGCQYGSHVREALCDIRSGMLSGWSGAPREVHRGEIGQTESSASHPAGQDRAALFEDAYDLAARDPFRAFVHPDDNPLLRSKIRELECDAVRKFGTFDVYA